MRKNRVVRVAALLLATTGLLMAASGTVVTVAAAADISNDEPFAGSPSVGGPCGQDGIGTWMRFTAGGSAGTFTRNSTGQSLPADLTFEQTADDPAKFRIISVVAPTPVLFGEIILFNTGTSGRIFTFDPPINSTGGDFLAPSGGGSNATHLMICSFPPNATFTVTKQVTYPAGTMAETGDPTEFAVTITCTSPGSTFNWASIQADTLSNGETTATVTAPVGRTCTATDAHPLFTTSAPSITLDATTTTTQSIVVTNAKKPTTKTLTVRKVVAGAVSGDPTTFDFSVACEPAQPAPAPANFTLANGATRAVTVPSGARCTVTEASQTLFNTRITSGDPDGTAIDMTTDQTIEFTNTRKVGALSITKDLRGTDAEENFTFTYNCAGRTGSVDIAGDTSATVLTNIPTGTSCSVTEDADAFYETSPGLLQTLTIAEGPNNVTFINTRRSAGLTIVKDRRNGSEDDEFTFDYSCSNGASGKVALGNGSVTPEASLPTGTNCTVTELPDPRYLTTGGLVREVTITDGGAIATFVNTRRTGSISIEKINVGGSASHRFDFEVDCGDVGYAEASVVGSGTDDSVLTVPTGTPCTVFESPDARYTTSPGLSQDIVVTEGVNTVRFTNTLITTDLGIDKSAPATVNAGTELTYTLTVTNHSATAAVAPIVTDSVPVGTTFVSFAPTSSTPAGLAWSCTTPATGAPVGEISCNRASLAPGATTTFTFVVAVPAGVSAGSRISNTAVISSSTPEVTPDPNSNTDTVDTDVNATASLRISKSAISSFATAGSEIAFTISVTNDGPSDASNVIVTDPVPAGLQVIVPSGSPCNAAGTTCTLGLLKVGQTTSFTLSYLVPAAYAGSTTITNVATVTSPTDPTPSTATATVPLAVLTVEKRVAASPPPPELGYELGDTITFDIIASNAGAAPLTGVTITENTTGVTLVGCGTGDTVSAVNAAGYAVPVGGRLRCVATRVVSQGDVDRGTFTNTATADADQTGPLADSVDVDLPQNPSIAVDKSTTSVGPYVVGSVVTFDIVVTNNGTVTLSNIELFEQDDATLASCDVPETLLPGDSFTCEASHVVTATDVADQQYSNTVIVEGTTPDEDVVEDDDTAIVPTPSADLAVTKSLIGALSTTGPTIFSIVVRNNGPSTAVGILIVDDALFGINITAASGTGWSCSLATGSARCSTATALPAGQSLPPITVTATVTALAGGTVQNRATVSGTIPDPVTSNNVSIAGDILPGVLPAPVLPRTGAAPGALVLIGLIIASAGVTLLIAGRRTRRAELV